MRKAIGYVGYTLLRSWKEAREFCEANHEGLAVINNIEEYESLKTVLQGANIDSNIWIGGTRVRDQWEWVTKGGPNMIMTWAKWAPGEPRGYEGMNCLQLWSNYQYDDIYCSSKKSFACML